LAGYPIRLKTQILIVKAHNLMVKAQILMVKKVQFLDGERPPRSDLKSESLENEALASLHGESRQAWRRRSKAQKDTVGGSSS
jgi:hypothetical protein